MDIDVPSEVERAGMIHFFEITFELSWKLMKDYFEEEGIQEIATPRQIINKAFEIGLIENGHHWLDALEDRNETVHIYDTKISEEIETEIRNVYLNEFIQLKNYFDAKR